MNASAAILICALLAAPTAEPSFETAPLPQLSWEWGARGRPWLLWAHGDRVRVRIRNTGADAWMPGKDFVSLHWNERASGKGDTEGNRIELLAPVQPGEWLEVRGVLRVRELHSLVEQRDLQWQLERGTVASRPALVVPMASARVLVVSLSGLMQWIFFFLLAGGTWFLTRRKASAQELWAKAHLPFASTLLVVTALAASLNEHGGLTLAHASIPLLLSAGALVALPCAFAPIAWRPLLSAALVVGVTAVAFGDLIHLRYFGSVIPVEALAGGKQVGAVHRSIEALFRPVDLLFLPAALGALICAGLVRFRHRGSSDARPQALAGARSRWGMLGGRLGPVALALPALIKLCLILARPESTELVYTERFRLESGGAVQVHVLNLARFVRKELTRETLAPEQLDRAREWYRARSAEAPRTPSDPWHGRARGANLLVIQAEALQQFALGLTVEGVEVTPTLNRLRGESLYFDNIYDQTNQGRTSDAEYAVLNSNHPLPRGSLAFLHASNSFHALPLLLQRQGYRTWSSHPNSSDFWNRGVIHPQYGFERLYFKDALGGGSANIWGLHDGAFLERIAGLVGKAEEPFFALAITVGAHHPFDEVPPEGQSFKVGKWEGTPVGNYLKVVHAFDLALGRLLEALKREGVLDRTVLAVYGDHDAGLEQDAPLLELLGESRWDARVSVGLERVPLFVRLPSGQGGTFHTPGGHVDIAPTLVHVLGLESPKSWVGQPLMVASARAVALPSGAVVGDERLYSPDLGADTEGCRSQSLGSKLPSDECAWMVESASSELHWSRLLVQNNLLETLGELDGGLFDSRASPRPEARISP